MYRYKAYELTVYSELELPGLPLVEHGGPPDVEVVTRRVDRGEMACEADGSKIGAYFFDIARFLIEDGRRIVVDVRRTVDDDVVSSRILGEIFSTLLRQRGLLVLHACAVERGGEAVAFVGESGWGKSTLAEAFRQGGYTLVTDDVMALSLEAGRPVLVPSYPQIRLRADSARHLEPSGEGLEEITRNGPKLARGGVALAGAGVTLAALYFLEPRYRAGTAIVDVAPSDALMQLVAHTRARTLIQTNTPGLLKSHLGQCAALVGAVRPAVLERRRSLDALPEVIEAVEGHLRSDGPGAPVGRAAVAGTAG